MNTNNAANDTALISLDHLRSSVYKILKEAHRNENMYPELSEIATYCDLSAWINKYYKCFYYVFQEDLLAVLAAIPHKSPQT